MIGQGDLFDHVSSLRAILMAHARDAKRANSSNLAAMMTRLDIMRPLSAFRTLISLLHDGVMYEYWPWTIETARDLDKPHLINENINKRIGSRA